MRTCTSVLLMVLAANAAAQAPAVRTDPGAATSAGSHGAAPQQSTNPSRNQFFSPVMGIQIEAQGVTLPKGVADEPIVAAPAQPASQPAAADKPAEPAPPTPK